MKDYANFRVSFYLVYEEFFVDMLLSTRTMVIMKQTSPHYFYLNF
jgi:hypothetical protein